MGNNNQSIQSPEKLIDYQNIKEINYCLNYEKTSQMKVIATIVVGETGSGKSSFLNDLLYCFKNQNKKFQVGQTQKQESIGITYFRIQLDNNIVMYLIDTQGFGSQNESKQYNQMLRELIKRISKLCNFVFFLEEGIRKQSISFNFFDELKNLQEINLKPNCYLVKNMIPLHQFNQYKKSDQNYKIIVIPFIDSEELSKNHLKSMFEPTIKKIFDIYIKNNQSFLQFEHQFISKIQKLIEDWNIEQKDKQEINFEIQNQQNQNNQKIKQTNFCKFKKNENKGNFEIEYDEKLFEDIFSSNLNVEKVQAIICCGRTGVGKSYFLTQICKELKQENLEFESSSSENQETVGINYHRFQYNNKDILLMDCQGFDYQDENLSDQDRKCFEEQLAFLICLFSKTFHKFIYMKQGIRDTDQLENLIKKMNEKALKFVDPDIIVIKNKLNSENLTYLQKNSNSINNNYKCFGLLTFNCENDKNKKKYDEQIKKIALEIIDSPKQKNNQAYSLQELGDYIQLSIEIFNGEIDRQLDNISKVLKLRQQHTQKIYEECDKFKINFQQDLKEQTENYKKQFDKSFFYCSQNIFITVFSLSQMQKLKEILNTQSQEWKTALQNLINSLQIEKQAVQKYERLERIAPPIIQLFNKYLEKSDQHILQNILYFIVAGGLVSGTTILGILAGTSAAAATATAVTVAEVGSVAATGLSGLAVSAITCGIAAGVFLLVGGGYIGAKFFLSWKKSKDLRSKSYNLLKDMRKKKILQQIPKMDKQNLQNDLIEIISKNFGNCQNLTDTLKKYQKDEQQDQQTMLLILISYQLIDNSRSDHKKMNDILQKGNFLSLYNYTKSQLQQLIQNNPLILCDLQFDIIYNGDFSEVKKKSGHTILQDGSGTIQNEKVTEILIKIENYEEYKSIYNSLVILRSQSKLFILNLLFTLLIEPFLNNHQDFILANFDRCLLITQHILTEKKEKS